MTSNIYHRIIIELNYCYTYRIEKNFIIIEFNYYRIEISL